MLTPALSAGVSLSLAAGRSSRLVKPHGPEGPDCSGTMDGVWAAGGGRVAERQVGDAESLPAGLITCPPRANSRSSEVWGLTGAG